jgi:hypothetical protein
MYYEENSLLSSAHSLQVSLKGVMEGTDGLDTHKQALLDRVPNTSDWAKVDKDSVDIQDLAFLSAKTSHEFALLKGKKNDILFHGEARHCIFDDDLVEMLKNGKLTLYAHSHPDYEAVIPSDDDREFLRFIGQSDSKIVSWITGKELSFTASKFDI